MEATPAPVLVEEILSYEIEVVNHGPETAEDLVLVTLATGISPLGQVVGPPPDVTLVTAPTECAQPDGPGNPLRCEMGDVAAGQTVTVILTVRPNAATLPLALGLPPLTNEAAVFTEGAVVGGDPDLDPSNNSASTVVQVLPKEGYDLAITRMEVTPDPAPMNQVLTYDIEVTNFGPDIAEDVVLFTLATGISPQGTGAPLDVTLVTAPAECAQPGGPGNLLRCELGDVGVGETVTVAVTVTPNSATLPLGLGLPPLTNEAAVFTQAAIAGGDQDLNPSNDTASTQVHVLPSDCSGTSPLTQVTMESHKTCTAVFDLLPSPDGFTLTVFNFGPEGVILGTVSSSPAGIDCSTGNIGVCEATFTSGTVVTLTAIDVEGTLFSWSDGDDCAHGAINRDVQIIMDSDKTCAAIFNPS